MGSYKTRAYFFKCLSLLPRAMGDQIYHRVQKWRGSLSLEKDLRAKSETASQIKEILEREGFSLKGKRVLELGSGWFPSLPYILINELGAEAVTTLDLNAHFGKDAIRSLNEYYGSISDHLLPSITYLPETNFLEFQPDHKFDILLTRHALEHMTPKFLQDMHEQAKLCLKKEGFILHFISPSDHRAYSDKSLSLVDFLKYSEQEWHRRLTRFDYHNRLRLPQYLDLFKKQGWKIKFLTFNTSLGNVEEQHKIDQLSLHSDYSGYSREELTAGAIQVLLCL